MPSDYMREHTWQDLVLDYKSAKVLNEIDIKNKEQEYKMLYGKK